MLFINPETPSAVLGVIDLFGLISMSTILLTATEVSQILGITPGTLAVWRATKRYDLPYVKSGRLVRYREEDVEAFITSRLNGEVSQ